VYFFVLLETSFVTIAWVIKMLDGITISNKKARTNIPSRQKNPLEYKVFERIICTTHQIKIMATTVPNEIANDFNGCQLFIILHKQREITHSKIIIPIIISTIGVLIIITVSIIIFSIIICKSFDQE
jgi:hypothetical protein